MRLRADELSRFGEALGKSLAPPAVIGLSGELGTGKTTLVQAICRGLGARVVATSPTYALVHHYETPGGRAVYHVDCYRLKSAEEARDLGFEDMQRRVPDLTKIQALTGYQPKYGLDDIILDVADFYKEKGDSTWR